jgi:hypothetical protein
MKTFLRLMMLLPIITLFGQQLKAQFAGNAGTLSFFELRDNEGGLIKTASEMGVVGNPMMLPDWGYGKIHFLSGKIFADSAMNLSLYNHKLFVKHENRFFEIVQPFSAVTLIYHGENGPDEAHTFKNGFPAVNGHDETAVYEVLFEGENLQLLTWIHKKVIETFNYGSPREKEYSLVQQYYVYMPKEKKMTQLSSYAINSVKKSLPAYADNIQAYYASHTINTRDKQQVLDLLAYLDMKH